MKRLMILTASIIAACFLSTACKSKNSAPSVTIHGKLDGSTIMASAEKPFSITSILAGFLPANAHAATTPVVTRVLAIQSNLNITSTIPAQDGSFALSVESGKTYILVFLNGLSIVGTYLFDSGTGLDSAPLPQASGDLNLQTVSYAGVTGRLTGSAGQDIVLQALGLDVATASAFGIMDDAK